MLLYQNDDCKNYEATLFVLIPPCWKMKALAMVNLFSMNNSFMKTWYLDQSTIKPTYFLYLFSLIIKTN